MRLYDDELQVTATDVANHQRCARITHLDRRRALEVAGGLVIPDEPPTLAMQKGLEHEAAVIAAEVALAEEAGLRIVDLSQVPRASRVSELRAAVIEGIDLIIQAPLVAGRISGTADLLRRVEDAAHPGGSLATVHRYEPVEIKFARHEKPAYALQVSAYATALADICGEPPERIHVWTERHRHTYATIDFLAYYRRAVEAFEADLELDLEEALAPVPPKIARCDGCSWAAECAQVRADADHLSGVAYIRNDQISKMEAVGVATLEALATTEHPEIAGIGQPTYERLRLQAKLQHDQRSERPGRAWRFREPNGAGRGFALLPDPDPGDMFFDFEGYPFHEAGAFEYLWGWSTASADGDAPVFDYIWCDTEAEERAAFERFLAHVTALRERSPGAHVYHYAAYEVTQLRRLAHKHADLADPLWPLLNAGVFVDLYTVVHQSMIVGTSSYSIKKLEPLYGRSRDGNAVDNAADSIVQYEQYIATDSAEIRQKIIDYNHVDCDSTIELRDWLLERRAEAAAESFVWEPRVERPIEDAAAADMMADIDAERWVAMKRREKALALLKQAALGILPEACDGHSDELRLDLSQVAGLLAASQEWGWREERVFRGELYGASATASPDDFVDDAEGMGSLQLVATRDVGRGSVVRTFQGPRQETLLKPKSDVWDPITCCPIGCVEEVDPQAGTLQIRTRGGVQRSLDQLGDFSWNSVGAVIGHQYIRTNDLEERLDAALIDFAQVLRDGGDPFEAASPHRLVYRMLAGRAPTATLERRDGIDHTQPERLADLIADLDDETLVVQGPPGTGKTWVTARTIAHLVARGLRVGISSNGHDAIRHLLIKLDEHLSSPDAPSATSTATVAYSHGSKGVWKDAPERVTSAVSAQARAMVDDGTAQIVAGTAWMYAGVDESLDVVFIDEAGQMGTLHTACVASATKRLVLVGDPQQLAQPAPIEHPFGAHQSPLDLMFAGRDTLPPTEGVLLPVTRRMTPKIAEWVSDMFYGSRLTAHPPTEFHQITTSAHDWLSGSGVRFIPVQHAGRSTQSEEEADTIAMMVRELLALGSYVDHDTNGYATEPRDMTIDDIVVVAPYNRQVSLLRERLPDGARVGTIDKFQGQEAAVSIWSVTASSADDVPRGIDFLLSPNRMNVVVSRARALAFVVASPQLLRAHCRTVEEMRLVNRLIMFAERGGGFDPVLL